MSQLMDIVVCIPTAVRFVVDEERHTIAVVKRVNEWMTQWTVPNNIKAYVGPALGAGWIPEAAVRAWSVRFNAAMTAALGAPSAFLSASDFEFTVAVSHPHVHSTERPVGLDPNVEGMIWINGDYVRQLRLYDRMENN
ncbi:hypothetical protein [Achromobacter phage Motura]|uniref:Uncharacterized protein n=1 Tax=Achromobacter phage Motura TaxID=2591403 RepID=A0A514CSW6_9CAUD|nr:hypothetical protein H1O15_gp233 [Achromobacter phage Motura]QDH83555.1 hypothetical protein [Achromobacter phage Motura]